MPTPQEIWGSALVFYVDFGDASSLKITNGLIEAFTDKAAGLTVTQATAGSRFAYDAAGYGGGGAAVFTNGKNFSFPQPASFPSGNAPHTMIVVSKFTGGGAYPTPFAYGGRGGDRQFRSMSARNNRINAGFYGNDHESTALTWLNIERVAVSMVNGADPVVSRIFADPNTFETKTMGGPLVTPTTSTVLVNSLNDPYFGPVRAILLVAGTSTTDQLTANQAYFSAPYSPPATGAVGAALGTSFAVGQGMAIYAATAASVASSLAVATALATIVGGGAAVDTSSAAATGALVITAAGVSLGSSTAAGDGRQLVTASGAALGTSLAQGAPGSATGAIGAAFGSSFATAERRALMSGNGAALGQSYAAAPAASIVIAIGAALGNSSAAGSASATQLIAGNGAAYGSSFASAAGAALLTGAGSAVGTSAATGVGLVRAVVVGAARGAAFAVASPPVNRPLPPASNRVLITDGGSRFATIADTGARRVTV